MWIIVMFFATRFPIILSVIASGSEAIQWQIKAPTGLLRCLRSS
jgi:hypothetical protein